MDEMDSALKESLDVAISLGSAINTLWQFYLTVILAIVTGLVFSKRQLTPKQKFVVTIAFLLFAGFNLSVLFNTYEVFSAALDEVRAQAAKVAPTDFKSDSLRKELRTIAIAPSLIPTIWLPIIVHVVVNSGVVCLICWNGLRRS